MGSVAQRQCTALKAKESVFWSVKQCVLDASREPKLRVTPRFHGWSTLPSHDQEVEQRGALGGVADVYGSMWLSSGTGSIIMLSGQPVTLSSDSGTPASLLRRLGR
jgi:hypothetical protein